MARDILFPAQRLGFGQVDVTGPDIGAIVACSMEANYPSGIRRLVLLDTGYSSTACTKIPMLLTAGQFGDWVDEDRHAFGGSPSPSAGVPEDLLQGRAEISTFLLLHASCAVAGEGRDRAIEAAACAGRDDQGIGRLVSGVRKKHRECAGYGLSKMPVLGLGAPGTAA